MAAGWFKGLEFVLIFGVAMGWGVWELVKVRRALRADERRARAAAQAAAAAAADGPADRARPTSGEQPNGAAHGSSAPHDVGCASGR